MHSIALAIGVLAARVAILLHVERLLRHCFQAQLGLHLQVDVNVGVEGALLLRRLFPGEVAEDADQDGDAEDERNGRNHQVDESVELALAGESIQEGFIVGDGLDLYRIAAHVRVLVETRTDRLLGRVVDGLERLNLIGILFLDGCRKAHDLCVLNVAEHLAPIDLEPLVKSPVHSCGRNYCILGPGRQCLMASAGRI